MIEDELLEGVTDLLTIRRWRWVHFRRSDKAKMLGHKGLPDIIAVSATRRRLLFIELKGTHGRVAFEQREWLDDLFAVAGLVVEPSSEVPITGGRMPEVYLWGPADWFSNEIDRRLR